jgi:hypothetical protein
MAKMKLHPHRNQFGWIVDASQVENGGRRWVLAGEGR